MTDFTVMAGPSPETHAEKIAKVMDMDLQVGAPCPYPCHWYWRRSGPGAKQTECAGDRISVAASVVLSLRRVCWEGAYSLGAYAEVFQATVVVSGPDICHLHGYRAVLNDMYQYANTCPETDAGEKVSKENLGRRVSTTKTMTC